MVLVLNGPLWFRGFESIFVFLAGIVTILIASFGYKAYRLTENTKYKHFGTAFLLLSMSFFSLSIFSSLLITHISDALTLALHKFDVVFLFHILLSLLAYMVLLIVTLKIEDKKVAALLLTLALVFVLFSFQHFLKFHIISLILLFFLSYQFYTNYLETKKNNAKLVFTSFYLLTSAEVFLIAHLYSSPSFYLVGRLLQFIGYVVLFYTFLQVVNHGRETREA